MKDGEKIAIFLSYILSPTAVALLVILLIVLNIMSFSNNIDFFLTLITSIFFLCILPIIGILIYTKKGKIDIWVSDRKTRTPFYALAILGYLTASIFFYLTNLNDLLILSIAYVSVTSTVALINLKTKISSHCAGLTGPLTAVVFMFGSIAFSLFLLLPLLIWARLHLDAHTHMQLITGSIIGILVTLSVYMIFY